VLRVAVASAAQLATLDHARALVVAHVDSLRERPYATTAVAALAAGVVVAVVMNPLDVVATRLYNQPPSGAYYAGVWACLARTVEAEGVRALWKGTAANYARLGPHTLTTFVAWHYATAATRDLATALGYD
jgi:solute carrier family 25 protein 34/35